MEAGKRRWGCVIGFDDAPSVIGQVKPVQIVGAVCARTRLDQVVASTVTRDGTDATDAVIACLGLPGLTHVRAVLFGGIGVGGRNIVDPTRIFQTTGLPVLVVTRRTPKLNQMRHMLMELPDGADRWSIIERLGPMEPVLFGHRPESGLPCEAWVQRAGLSIDDARVLLTMSTLTGNMPEPLRLAHIIAGGITDGISRGRA